MSISDEGGVYLRSRLAKFHEALDLAVVDALQWSAVCDHLAEIVGGVGTAFIACDPQKRGPWLAHSKSISQAVSEYIGAGWYLRDVRQRCLPFLFARGYSTELDFTDDAQMRRSPYYEDFLAKHDLRMFIGIQVAGDSIGGWLASIQLPRKAGPPDNATCDLIPHLRQSLLKASEASEAIGAESVDRWLGYYESADRGLVLLGHDGSVKNMNLAASRFLRGALARGGKIVLKDAVINAPLQELITRACLHSGGQPRPVLADVEGRSLAIDVLPLPLSLRHYHSDVAAIVVVRPYQESQITKEYLLCQKYNLRPSEAIIAIMIAEGKTVSDISEHRSTSIGTVRNQLKIIYKKMNIESQLMLSIIVNAKI